MNDRRRGLGRGLGALIPPAPSGVDRPSDVFFPRQTPAPAGQGGATALLSRSPDGPEQSQGGHPAPAAAPVVGAVSVDERGESHRSTEEQGHTTTPGQDDAAEVSLAPVPGAHFAEIPVDDIQANPRQPRQVFDEDDLAELEHSIREIGVLQPVVVRSAPTGFELIMGERRLRAARNVGLSVIPAIVRETADDDMLRDALLENLHRSQLNPLEEAAAYQQLLDDFGCTHEVLATRIGRSRPQISNTLRLMKLPPLVQRRVAAGVLSAGHARALLGLSDGAAMERLAQRIVAEGLSVRSVEEIVVLGGDSEPAKRRPSTPRESTPELAEHATRLADRLDTRVAIAMGRRKGKVTVEFASLEDLERILDLLGAPTSGN